MPLPLIGPRQAGEVRLAPQLRSRLRRRAFGLARAEFRPAIAADRAALQSVRHQRRTDVRSVAGATGAAEKAIRAAERSLRSSGLPGSYRGQVGQALSSRAADVASSAPALAATVRQGYASDIASAKGAIVADRAQLQKTGAETLYSELSKARTQGRSYLSKQATRAKKGKTHARNVKSTQRAIHNAVQTGLTLLRSYPPTQQTPNPLPENEREWAQFTLTLAQQEAINQNQARQAVKIIRRNPGLGLLEAGGGLNIFQNLPKK